MHRHRQDQSDLSTTHTIRRASAITFIAVALIVLGCVTRPAPTSSQQVSASASPSTPTLTAPTSSPSSRASGGIEISAQWEVVYTNEPAMFVLRVTTNDGHVPQIAEATISFGDGTTATLTAPCESEPAPTMPTHVYQRTGTYAVSVLSSRQCDGTKLSPDGAAGVLVEPSAPEDAAPWPICKAAQLDIAVVDRGSALGNGGAIVTFHNVASTACRLEGFPRLDLIGPNGLLRTRWDRAIEGAYLFPAIPARLVAVPPDAYTSFQIAYGANPFGPGAEQPPDYGCLATTRLRIFLPETNERTTAPFEFAPCDGFVAVSPVFPGREWIEFQ